MFASRCRIACAFFVCLLLRICAQKDLAAVLEPVPSHQQASSGGWGGCWATPTYMTPPPQSAILTILTPRSLVLCGPLSRSNFQVALWYTCHAHENCTFHIVQSVMVVHPHMHDSYMRRIAPPIPQIPQVLVSTCSSRI